jgi:hypothetical protein
LVDKGVSSTTHGKLCYLLTIETSSGGEGQANGNRW